MERLRDAHDTLVSVLWILTVVFGPIALLAAAWLLSGLAP